MTLLNAISRKVYRDIMTSYGRTLGCLKHAHLIERTENTCDHFVGNWAFSCFRHAQDLDNVVSSEMDQLSMFSEGRVAVRIIAPLVGKATIFFLRSLRIWAVVYAMFYPLGLDRIYNVDSTSGEFQAEPLPPITMRIKNSVRFIFMNLLTLSCETAYYSYVVPKWGIYITSLYRGRS